MCASIHALAQCHYMQHAATEPRIDCHSRLALHNMSRARVVNLPWGSGSKDVMARKPPRSSSISPEPVHEAVAFSVRSNHGPLQFSFDYNFWSALFSDILILDTTHIRLQSLITAPPTRKTAGGLLDDKQQRLSPSLPFLTRVANSTYYHISSL